MTFGEMVKDCLKLMGIQYNTNASALAGAYTNSKYAQIFILIVVLSLSFLEGEEEVGGFRTGLSFYP